MLKHLTILALTSAVQGNSAFEQLIAATSIPQSMVPQSFHYDEFESDQHFSKSGIQTKFRTALSDVGVVTISGIPDYALLRREVLRDAHRCARSLPEDVVRGHFFEDGTQRLTLAMSGKDGELNVQYNQACPGFSDKLARLRQLISRVSRTFFKRMDQMLDFEGSPLLSSSSPGTSYETLEDVLQHGAHLDHIHSYNRNPDNQEKASTSPAKTMDFHTDQGLAIAFTPAMLLDEESGEVQMDGADVGTFEIQLRSGARTQVKFPQDHLVFMLGDGVNQYVNPRKMNGPDMRAAPHAMNMPHHTLHQWRVWFGRMFLPPTNAIQPEHGLTYGDLQSSLKKSWVKHDETEWEPQLAIGCSGSQHAAELRQLSSDPPCSSGSRRRCSGGCANNQLQCWWRCMNFTDSTSPDACEAKASGFNCTNMRDEISLGGVHHGPYDIRCTNSTQLVRGNCELEQINANRPADADNAGFESFIANQGTFQGRHDLLIKENNETEVAFLWNVVGTKVQGLMAVNGMVSWVAIGIENIGGGLRGMKGGHVLMGVSSQDLEYPGLSGVHEYKIHDVQSRFNFWNTPYPNPATTDTGLISQNGYTAMKFTTDAIYGEKLNITSDTNRLIWAVRASTYMHIGKDSYHEGCNGEETTRYRGGGENNPWIVDFNKVQNAPTTTKAPAATGGTTRDATDTGELRADSDGAMSSRLSMIAGLLVPFALSLRSCGIN